MKLLIHVFFPKLPPISSTDADSGKNGTKGIRYSIIGTGLPFDINDITGAVFTNGSGLDRESQPEYTIQVYLSAFKV